MARQQQEQPVIKIGSSDVEVIEDSEPERQASIAKSETNRGSSVASSSGRKPAVASGATSEDSDIELVATKVAVKTRVTVKPKGSESGFASARSFLKSERQKSALQAKQQRERDEKDQAARSVSPYFENDSRALSKGKGRAKSEEQSEDEFIEALPPPLKAARSVQQLPYSRPISAGSAASASSDSDTAVSAFKKTVSGFKAPGVSRQSSITESLLLPGNGRSKSIAGAPLNRASSLSDSSSGASFAKPGKNAAVVKPPQITVPTELLNVMTNCPVCKVAWAAEKTKTAAGKHGHIRKCAVAKGFREDTVLDLSYRQVEQLKSERDEIRRKAEAAQTLFDNVVSKKGKDVLVVGVEEKRRKAKLAESDSLDSKEARKEAVLYTQGGSAHSQATHTQVQRELDKNIKANQKIDGGEHISLLRPSQDAIAANIAAKGTGSKQWQKAEGLLAARANGTTADSKGYKLESYATSRFRLAEKAKQILESRSASSASSADEAMEEGQEGSAKSFERPYRKTDKDSISVIDRALSVSTSRTYEMWSLNGGESEAEVPKTVSSPAVLPDSPPRPPVHASSAATGISPTMARIAITAVSTNLSTSSSGGLLASTASLDALMAKMQARPSARRTVTSSAVSQRARDSLQKLERLQDAAHSQQPAAEKKPVVRRRRSASRASDSSEDLPIAMMPGASPPIKRKPGRPRKSPDPDGTPMAIKISPKRPSAASSGEGEAVTGTSSETAAAKGKVKAATSSPASPKKRAKKAAPIAAATSSTDAMPDYNSWERAALQAETAKYGYKPSTSKTVLVGQLTRIWAALHPDRASNGVPSPSKAARSRVKAAAAGASASNSDAEVAMPEKVGRPKKLESTDDPLAKPKATRKKAAKPKVAEDDIDVESDPEDLRSAGERLREAILADEPFYLRLLRYEPICFTDFEAIAAKLRIKISKVALRDWLDSQAIIFYYPQDTGRNAKRNGARKRHP